MIWSLAFWKGAGERALHTFIQAFFAILFVSLLTGGIATVTRATFLALPWETAVFSAIVAALMSLWKSLRNPEFTAGEPATVLTPDVIAVMADDPEAKARFQASMSTALFAGADEARRAEQDMA